MAGAGTVPVLADAPILVLALIVIIRMTTGTVRLVAGCRPGDRLGITFVTGRAIRIATVIAGIGGARVVEDIGGPTICRVTVVALLAR